MKAWYMPIYPYTLLNLSMLSPRGHGAARGLVKQARAVREDPSRQSGLLFVVREVLIWCLVSSRGVFGTRAGTPGAYVGLQAPCGPPGPMSPPGDPVTRAVGPGAHVGPQIPIGGLRSQRGALIALRRGPRSPRRDPETCVET